METILDDTQTMSSLLKDTTQLSKELEKVLACMVIYMRHGTFRAHEHPGGVVFSSMGFVAYKTPRTLLTLLSRDQEEKFSECFVHPYTSIITVVRKYGHDIIRLKYFLKFKDSLDRLNDIQERYNTRMSKTNSPKIQEPYIGKIFEVDRVELSFMDLGLKLVKDSKTLFWGAELVTSKSSLVVQEYQSHGGYMGDVGIRKALSEIHPDKSDKVHDQSNEVWLY